MMIRLTGMYERTSAKTGLMYFTGRLNMGSRMLLLPNLKAEEGDPPWELFLADAENTLTNDQIAKWKAEHGGPEAIVDREQGLAAALGDRANVKAPKKRRGRKPKVKLEHDEDPDDGLPDWMGAG